MTYSVPIHTKHSQNCLYHIEQEQVDCDCGGNMTDHAKKLEEIEGRHNAIDAGAVWPMDHKDVCHADRAYLLSRVRELEAAHETLRTSWDESLAAAEDERDRLRAECSSLRSLLSAPVTEDEIKTGMIEMIAHAVCTEGSDAKNKELMSKAVAIIFTTFLAARRSK